MSWKTSTWPSQSGPAPMPMVGVFDFGRDHGRDFARNAFEINAGHASAVESDRIAHELLDRRQIFALHLVAAHHVHRLRRQADVSGHGNLGIDDAADQVGALLAAFNLHRFRARFFHKTRGVAHGFVGTDVIRTVRHVGDEQRVLHAAAHGLA